MAAQTLHTVPIEVLERIAYCVGAAEPVGPPSDLVRLVTASRALHSALSVAANPILYGRLFKFKFDAAPLLRRLAHLRRPEPSAQRLAEEFVHRFAALGRLRAGDGRAGPRAPSSQTRADLWTALLLILEDEGRNGVQLCEYAGLLSWLRDYWHNALGPLDEGERFGAELRTRTWPGNNEQNALAMWLFWLLLKPNAYAIDDDIMPILKVLALGGHKYPLCMPAWEYLHPPAHAWQPLSPDEAVTTYHDISIALPPLATPAVLSYLTMLYVTAPAGPGATLQDIVGEDIIPPSLPSEGGVSSTEWDSTWERCIALGSGLADRTPHPELGVRGIRPGSLAGIWEGMFMYTEFHTYAALLIGAPPTFLEQSAVAQHRQTWRLTEHHLRLPRDAPPPSLLGGGALDAFLPDQPGLVTLTQAGLEVHCADAPPLMYTRCDDATSFVDDDATGSTVVHDIIITGEGHSAWGQFRLQGRVRPCDGFVSLSKIYAHGGRGHWLYRGYLVGDARGNLVGRWRDSATPPNQDGYEGCFSMRRR